jgi:flagellar motor switch protein FliN
VSEQFRADSFFQVFLDAFHKVLSQCTGATWTATVSDNAEAADLVWVNTNASAALAGEFGIGFTAQAGIVLAQILMMAEKPSTAYGQDEKEATTELLRQVCGLASTALTRGASQPVFEVRGEGSALAHPASTRALQFSEGTRSVNIVLAIDSALETSLQAQAAPVQDEPAPAETDRVGLQQALATSNLDLLMNVRLGVRLRFGSRRMKLREILEFHAGTIVELDRQVQEPVDLLVDNKLIARGEVVVVDGNYGLKVIDVVSPRQCVDALY